MARAAFRPTRFRRVAALCIVIVLAGLAAHLVADVTGGSPDLVGLRHLNNAGKSAPEKPVATAQSWGLADDLALPVAIHALGPTTPASSLISVRLAWSDWSPSPPVRPPLQASLTA